MEDPLHHHLQRCKEIARTTLRALAASADTERWCILDTETSGLEPDCSVYEVAAIDPMGGVLFHSIIRPPAGEWAPGEPVGAEEHHGITGAMLERAPRWSTAGAVLLSAIEGRRVVAWNAEFDAPRLYKQIKRAGLSYPGFEWTCAMQLYAELVRAWDATRHQHAYVKLSDAGAAITEAIFEAMGERAFDDALLHRAATDAELTRRVLAEQALDLDIPLTTFGLDALGAPIMPSRTTPDR